MFINEQAGNVSWGWKGELKGFYLIKLLPSEANKLTAGNLGGWCRPPYEIRGVEFPDNKCLLDIKKSHF